MQQDAANRVRPEPTRLVSTTVDALGDADRLRLLSLIAELGRIVQHKNRPIGADHPIARRLKMTSQNVGFAHSIVGEEAIGSLGRSEEHTSELQSLMRISYAGFALKQKNKRLTSPKQC